MPVPIVAWLGEIAHRQEGLCYWWRAPTILPVKGQFAVTRAIRNFRPEASLPLSALPWRATKNVQRESKCPEKYGGGAMSGWDPLGCGIIARFLVLFCVAVFPPRARAQSQEVLIRGSGKMVPVCKLADLDSNVSFFSNETDFIVAFNLQNISESPCAPQPSVSFPMFDLQQIQKTKPFELCTDCEDRLPNGQYRYRDPVVLNSGDIAYQTYRWKTAAPAETVTCLPLQALFTPVLVVAPSLFKPVCSEIAVSGTYTGEFVPPPEPKDLPQTEEEQSDEVFVLSSRKPRYYHDEMFTLRVGLADSVAGAPTGEECPILFLRVRSPDGTTRFDQVPPNGFKTCETFTMGANRNADWQSGFEVGSGVGSRWGGLGEHSLELFQLVGSSREGTTWFVHSNKLTVQIDDPALISRKWQGKVNGVGVDVTLDKDTYKLGEDIPLHIATQNFDAPVPIYATSAVWDPYAAIGVEVRDAIGRPLPGNERFSDERPWIGHGRGPFLYPPGKLVTIERTLESQGWLPNRPGVYTVVVTWCTFDGTHVEPASELLRNDELKPYETVRAAATFRIVAESSPGSHAEP